MIETMTTCAEGVALLAIAVGLAWLVLELVGFGLAAIVFGAVILCMSAAVQVIGRKRGGPE